MVLRPLPAGARFSAVEVSAEGHVRSIRGRPRSPDPVSARPLQMWTGVQILSARAWRDLPQNGDIIEHAYFAWLERGEIVASVTEHAPWYDVGVTPRDYLEANLAVASGSFRWPGVVPGDSGVIADPEAQIGANSRLTLACIGAHAQVAAASTLHRVVVWPGAQVSGTLEDAIVTGSGQIVRVAG
jgi:mannose-1-phosphate guanylyltransferase